MTSKATILTIALLGVFLILADARCTVTDNSNCHLGKIKRVTDDSDATCIPNLVTNCKENEGLPCCSGYCEKRSSYGQPWTICVTCDQSWNRPECEKVNKQ
ncbi:hypothetical protein Mapa_001117 [Marchantia paleacea]|nr:hypothetical protein Mapa_001117 [Marchantia paleacea]